MASIGSPKPGSTLRCCCAAVSGLSGITIESSLAPAIAEDVACQVAIPVGTFCFLADPLVSRAHLRIRLSCEMSMTDSDFSSGDEQRSKEFSLSANFSTMAATRAITAGSLASTTWRIRSKRAGRRTARPPSIVVRQRKIFSIRVWSGSAKAA